jgi:hypothetical protein
VENPRVQLVSVFATDAEERQVEVPVGTPDTNEVPGNGQDQPATDDSAERRNS